MKNTLLFLAFAAAMLFAGLQVNGQSNENRTVTITESYNGISLAGNHHLHFEIGTAGEPITVIGHAQDLDKLEIYVDNNTLKIKYPNNYNSRGRVQIYAKNPTLKSASVAGSGTFDVSGKLDDGDKKFAVAGSGKINADGVGGGNIDIAIAGSGKANLSSVNAATVTAKISGSGKADLEGQAEKLTASIAGSGKINGEILRATDADVKISGSGKADIHCTGNLNVSVSGSGKVVYSGDPQNIHASGRIAGKNLEKK